MGRIFITGSADGLGLLAAKSLIAKGHQVVVHARNEKRKLEGLGDVKGLEEIVIGDLSNLEETKDLAKQVNDLGSFDAIIHNAGLYQAASSDIFSVNTLAPFVLTSLINKPKRIIYLSSDMHRQGRPTIDFSKTGIEKISYSDSKFHVLMLSLIVARKWEDVYSNAVDPGWVPTKMGGKSAPENLDKGYEAQVWLTESDDQQAKVSGRYFYHKTESKYKSEAGLISFQEEFINACQEISGVEFPG